MRAWAAPLLAILAIGCSVGASPTAPTQVPTAADVVAAPVPAAAVPPFRVEISAAQRGPLQPGDVWHGLVTVTATDGVVGPAAPSRLIVTCPGDVLRLDVGFGQNPFTCLLPFGSHIVRAVVETRTGFSASAEMVVVVGRPPAVDVVLYVWSVFFDPAGTDITFAVPAWSKAHRYRWAFGDSTTETTLTPFVRHRYPVPAGQREVTVRVLADDGWVLATGRIVGVW